MHNAQNNTAPQMESALVPTYRIASGKVKLGKGDGDVILDAIAGFLTGFDYIEGTNEETGDDYARLRCELELKDGSVVRVGCKVGIDKTASQITPCGFALGLMAAKEGDDILIQPALGKPDPRYGKCSTFVNVGIVNPLTGRYIQVKPDREQFPGEKMKEKWAHILKAYKAHPLYRDLSPKEEDTELDIFAQISLEGKWADPLDEAYKPIYLKGLQKRQAGVKDYSDCSAETLAGFAEWYESNRDNPPKALARPVETEYDPFADTE
jgi:hypothetical protein